MIGTPAKVVTAPTSLYAIEVVTSGGSWCSIKETFHQANDEATVLAKDGLAVRVVLYKPQGETFVSQLWSKRYGR